MLNVFLKTDTIKVTNVNRENLLHSQKCFVSMTHTPRTVKQETKTLKFKTFHVSKYHGYYE